MADVVIKGKNANDVKNGSAVILAGGKKTFQTNNPGPPVIVDRTLNQIEAEQSSRFDDTQYYTA